MTKTPEQIVALVREAGVIGAAGVGYPTDIKLQAKADIVIINGSECEPLAYTDKLLLETCVDDIARGLKLAMTAVGASQGVIAVNGENQEAMNLIRAAAVNHGVSVFLMSNYYPAGDEMLATYDVTGRVVPEGANPLDVGVLVLGVATARQIYQAVNGVPVTERTVSITGAVREPSVVTVPIGTRYADLLTLAGGPAVADVTVLDGGPMMGSIVSNLETGISKSTSTIVSLPTEHHLIQMKLKSVAEIARQSKGANGQRTQSTDLCPRYLLGHSIEPHQVMTALDYSLSEPSGAITAAFLCSGCGVCEVIGDESSMTSPRKIYAEFKSKLVRAGVKNPHQRKGFPVHSQYQNRKLSVPTLIQKLGIGDYVRKPQVLSKKEISLVRVPTSRHVGVAAHPRVKPDQTVRRGDLIAASPDDHLGSLYHSPFHGCVTDITETYIEITRALQ